jgi:MYXO-CTERM domain-containing protein
MHLQILRVAAFVMVFLTSLRAFAAAPTATTSAATAITTSSAILNGAGVPNGESTLGWFRISSTNPGTCDDVFGTRVPASSGTDLGTGAASVPYSITSTGLSSGVTYYFCAIVANPSGTAFGTVLSFTVPGQPAVLTTGTSAVTSSGATLQGSGNPTASSTTGWFRYSTTNPGTCDDVFGTRAPASSGSALGSGTSPVAYTRAITGLTPGTLYYYCAIAQNAYGTSFGAVLSFTSLANAPAVTTSSATLLTSNTAQLNGSVNPGGDPTTGWFRYATSSPGSCNDTFGTRAPTTGGSALGAGNSGVAYGQGITGLSPLTTYYYCAIAQNSVGTSLGSLLTFTTPAPPSVTTTPATGITSTTAFLAGTGNPNSSATTGWFRYSLTNPGTCNDTFGSRAPATGGTTLGSGNSAVAYTVQIIGLSPGTLYYFCAIAQNAEGTGLGAVLSFTTPNVPTVTTAAATAVTSSGATLNGTANPNGDSTYGHYRYSTTSPGTCNDAFGTRAPVSSPSDTSLGAGSTAVAYGLGISGLAPATTYYFCAIGNNTYGTSFGAVLSFTTLANAPVVTTSSASPLTGTTATLNGTANPGGAPTTGWFRYSTTSPGSCNDTFGTRAPASAGSALGAGQSAVAYGQALTGLTPATLYYFCAIAQNSVGTGFGSVLSFTTPAPPTVTTSAATTITNTTAYLNGAATPNGSTTTGWFRYSLTNPGTCDDVFGSRAPVSGGSGLGAGNSAVAYQQQVTGLSAGTTYYFCAIASSIEGVAVGAVLSFTTPNLPTVTTSAATAITSTTATLNGSANPNLNGAYGHYRYSTVNPGSCNDTFGTRIPTSSASDTYLGTGGTPVAYALGIGGLTPATTYYFCAISYNSYGTGVGAVLSFTTLANPPVVTTSSATLLTGTTATLNGAANPGGDATTGWFRFATASPGTCNDTFGTRAPASGGSALGTGNSAVAYGQAITGLTAGTTYYFCAIAQNSAGTSFGAVVSFLTPLPPTATTTAASSVANTSAYLNGTGTPNGSTTTGWFRYSTTSPGTCDDVFGSRAPASGGSGLGSGYAAVGFQQQVTGLSAGTTYYYCAIVSSFEGMAFGAVLSFTTPNAPTMTTSAATAITSTTTTLNGTENPNLNGAYGHYRYSTVNPGACNDTFGTRVPTSSASDTYVGTGGTPVAYALGIGGLTPATTYYFCSIGYNSYGTAYGAVLSFTTLANPPVVTTNSATLLTGTTATLNGTANPGGDSTTGWFRYSTASPGSCNDTFGTRAPTTGGSALGSGSTGVAYAQALTGLLPATTYYYCAIAQNSVGTSFGSIVSFLTPSPPTVTTTAASSITNTSAYLNGAGTPNGSATTAWFRFSLTNPGACDDVFGSRAPVSGGSGLGSGYSAVAYQQQVTGLSAGTTYYYCAIASSLEGIAFGTILTFTTPNQPTVVTSAATAITPTTATLNGTANPNLNGAYGHYRYSTVNPGLCTDSFGTRIPTSSASDTYLGTGGTPVAYALGIGGLTPATTYYFCAISYNSYGTGLGSVLSFTTLANPPVVTTSSATLLTGTTATLNGSANPGGDATAGWFRYATASPGTCNDTFGTRAPSSGGSALGNGNSAVAYAQAITGLNPGTTYYFCAIALNSAGTSFGAVVSFLTPLPPTATTTAASSVANTSAYLNGTGTPNGSTTTGWFRYSTTSPGTCDDVFGSRAPASGGSGLGSGYAAVGFQQQVTGLSAGTTYYYCAIVSSFEGMAFGAVLSFTTPNAPTMTTSAATAITSTTTTLNGTENPNLNGAYGHYRYSTVNPGACNDTFGTRVPTSSASDTYVGTGGTPVAYALGIGGLTPATTYYFCSIGYNSYGTAYGAVLSFTTLANPPVVTTNSATLLTGTTATLNGTANPGGDPTTGWFRYSTASPGSCNDTFGTRAPASGGSALGAGNTGVAYAQAITGLTALTTYYYCAIAQNSVGTSFGSIVSFTTPAPPTVTTAAASSITNTTAYLNGSANPTGAATTGWFRYALTNPGACDDVFGSRAPVSGGSGLGSGSSAVAYQQQLTGLSAGTTYYFCAIASNAEGIAFGAVLSFTTPNAPTVTTTTATLVTSSSATLNGTVNPNLNGAYGHFRYSTVNPGACNDTFGTRIPASSASDTYVGTGGTPVAYALGIGGLTPGTSYYFCAIGYNTYGTAYGAVLSLTTLATVPSVTTSAATSVTTNAATLNASANPNGDNTTGWFRYATSSPGTCNDTFGTRAPATGGSALGGGTTSSPFTQGVTGLIPGTTYYFCAIGQNSVGTSFGAVLTFVTTAAPTVATLAATPVTATTATLNGSVNPNGYSTTGWFRYATVDPGACDNVFGTITGTTALGAGLTPVALAQPLTGLTPATTYYFCAIAQSSIGTSLGAVLSFTTPAAPPSVTTQAASSILDVSATLNASVNPNGSPTTGWFRYSTVNPGTCNDTFGTRAPTSGGTALGGASSPVAESQGITGLTAGTTYYFCALASSAIGNSVGSVLSFTTASLPVVTTTAATALTSTSATLNGSANPNLSAATGWFRYDPVNPGACNDTFGTRAPASGGSTLGAGGAAVAYGQALAGLTSATTYYFCAIAQNAVGTSFGAVLTFTTAATPAVTTVAASAVTATGATLNGSANPNLLTATGWLRYSTVDPGTCNDTFGTRAPASGGSALGAGSTGVAYSQTVAGLAAGTTYFFCAIASNSAGTGFGTVMSFTTAAAPTVTTAAATAVTTTGATLNGSANPNQLTATGWFRYATVSPGTCNDTFGTRSPAAGGAALGAGTTAVAYSQAVTGLTQGTTYYFCAIASNSQGTRFGVVLSFVTPAAPTVTTVAASAVTSTGATLNGTANPNNVSATGWLRYDTTNPGTCNDTFGTRVPAAGGTALGAGGAPVPYAQAITGLAAGTTYYFCAIADNGVGTAFGAVLSFTTPSLPTVTTSAATLVTASTATLNGSANPSLSATTGWFRYDTTNPGTCDDVFGTRAPASGGSSLGAGGAAVAYGQAITGLASATTYYFCAIAQNAVGTSFGAVLSFTTAAAPSVTSVAASAVTGTGATLNGSANPNLLTATGWFRYSATDPGTCNDTFGTRAPAAGGTALGAGGSGVPYSQAVAGLTAGTTYYFCAIASNTAGTGLGAVLNFTTAGPPTVTTVAASGVTNSGATLNGSANPNQLTATGWFRYATTSPGLCNDTFGTRAPAAGGTALGAGTSAVAYAQTVTGLAAGTTYYFCAIASNAQATRLGAVLSFTTTAGPTVVTAAATAVSNTGATLNGSANPNLGAATGWFRFSTTNPGTCNDTFGTRAPATGGTSLGNGSAPVPYAQALTGLAVATTYYFCAIADNGVATGLGGVLSFTTTAPPTVTTVAASSVASTSATLNGSANPNLDATTGWLRFGTTNPGTCNDTFGTRAPASGGSSLGAGGTAVAYAQALTGLAPATTYYFCAIAQNGVGMDFGAVLSFTTTAAPFVTTVAATGVTGTAAALNGAANPNLLASTGWYRYSTTSPGTCNDTFGTRAPTSGGTSLGAGGSAVVYAQSLTGLTAGTTYYFCAIASNAVGTGFGAVLSFTTLAAPSVATDPPTAVTSTTATLNGTATPNLAATTGWFRYSATDPGTCNDTFGTRLPSTGGSVLGAGSSPVDYGLGAGALAQGTTYYYCAIASNSQGTSFGTVVSFTTPGAPAVVTQAATSLTSVAATLNGSANPNLVDATGWFRYSATDPGTCTDSFGTRAPTTGGTSLGNGGAAVLYAQALTGLTPGTTYYYCAIASNAVGTSFGAVMSFTTPAPPAVVTQPATALFSNAAVLNGLANPNLDATLGWFRYDTTDPGACDDAFGTRAPAVLGTSLGAGSTPTAFPQPILGLAPTTTYYFCAVAENTAGKSFGAVLSFTTTAEPAVTTKAATALTSTGATLNGSANPNLLATTGWYRYDTTAPAKCDDTFGTRAPTSGGTDVGAGSADVDYAQAVTGLLPATTYYFCAIASSSGGTAFGEVLTLTTPADAPVVVTSAPTSVQTTSATLNGSANPDGDATTAWFRYDTTDPGACDDTFGKRAPTTGGTDVGAGAAPVAFSQPLTGLTAWTTYYYCAIASNAEGTRFGKIVSFVPGAVPPTVTTVAATDVLGTSATLAGTANPHGGDAQGWFRYGDTDPGTCDDSFGKRAPDTDSIALGAGNTAAPFSLPLDGLEAKTQYFYCAAASNLAGAKFGKVLSFTTVAAPPVITTKAADVTKQGAVTLNGVGNPNASETVGYFRVGDSNPAACDDTFGNRVPATDGTALGAGRDDVPFSQPAASLPAGTYYYCAVGTNEAGTVFGEVLSFDVPKTDTTTPSTDSGCGCRVGGSAGQGGSLASLLALTLLALRRRRRA